MMRPPTIRKRRGFTLTEVLVALAIFMVLMLVMLVPMNLGLTATQIGRARSEIQSASRATLGEMEDELRRAVYVFPNTRTPGVTDGAPYNTPGFGNKPYVQVEGAVDLSGAYSSKGVCQVHTDPTDHFPVNNTARLDFLLPRTDSNGVVISPLQTADYLVTYYARRLYTEISPPGYYDEVDNPIVLFRAQVPYRNGDDTDFAAESGAPANSLNLSLKGTRYPDSATCATQADRWNRSSLWLTQNTYAEPDLEKLFKNRGDAAGPVAYSHTLLTPRGMGLVAPFASEDIDPPSARHFKPTTSFTCDDTNGDGKLDRVTINLELSQYDAGGNAAQAQRVRTSLTVDLPNIR